MPVFQQSIIVYDSLPMNVAIDGEQKNIHQTLMKPIKDVFVRLGTRVVSQMTDVMALNPDKAVQEIKKKLDASVSKIRDSENETVEPVEPNLPVARQTIDTLEMLTEKTRGNLTDTESKLLESILYELHMRFVEASK